MDREGREERVRDSGIADIPALDNIIANDTLESIEEESEEFHDTDDPTSPDMANDDRVLEQLEGLSEEIVEPLEVQQPQSQCLPQLNQS